MRTRTKKSYFTPMPILLGLGVFWFVYASAAQYIAAADLEKRTDATEDASFAFIQMMQHEGFDDIVVTPVTNAGCEVGTVLQATFTARKPGLREVRGKLCIGPLGV